MKFETRPVEVEAIQWEGNPETLPTVLEWVMSDRVAEKELESPRITYNIWWGGFEEDPQIEGRIRGYRWSIEIMPGDWIIKDGAKIYCMPDKKFKATFKQKRGR
jgi:hypothetical protein